MGTDVCWGFIARGFEITYESPKSEKVALFELGERAYDHLLILPPKSKGTTSLSLYLYFFAESG